MPLLDFGSLGSDAGAVAEPVDPGAVFCSDGPPQLAINIKIASVKMLFINTFIGVKN
jgi:hypothetical protein